MRILPKPQYAALYKQISPDYTGVLPQGFGDPLSGEAVVPKGASTTTRLHELAHELYEHRSGSSTVDEFIDKELDAEQFARESMSKRPDWKIGIIAANELVEDYNFRSHEAVLLVVSRLRTRNIPVSAKEVRSLERRIS